MFKIQLSNPVILPYEGDDAEITLDEAIESIFPSDTEYLILTWNHIYIPLNYKYDISCMISDFIRILQFMENDSSEPLEIYWTSNTFASIWTLHQLGNEIKLHSKWNCVIGGTENLLNKSSENQLEKEEFKNEIKKLLAFIYDAIKKSVMDFEKISEIDLLKKYI
jgi:hypothetical protein